MNTPSTADNTTAPNNEGRNPMNRADLARNYILFDQLASAARAKAATFKEQLNAEARTEYEQQGMAPTWRLSELGTVTLPVSKPAAYCADEAAFTAWVEHNYPDAIDVVRVVNPQRRAEIERRIQIDGDAVVDPAGGEVVPGWAVRPGGTPLVLTVRPTSDAKSLIREHADGLLSSFEATLTGDLTTAQPPADA